MCHNNKTGYITFFIVYSKISTKTFICTVNNPIHFCKICFFCSLCILLTDTMYQYKNYLDRHSYTQILNHDLEQGDLMAAVNSHQKMWVSMIVID